MNRQGFWALTAILALMAGAAVPEARADLLPGGSNQFAVLGQVSNNQTNFNNGTITGDVGIGSPRQFTISNASVVGNIRFSGASNVSGITPNPTPGSGTGPFTVSGGGTVSGNVVANDSTVTNALNALSTESQTLGAVTGTTLTLTSSQTINASSGVATTINGETAEVFNAAGANLSNGTVLDIQGSATDLVVVNVTATAAFNGQIVLTGGLTSDHVLFNLFGGDFTTHTGGPTLTISTNGQTTTGIFLDLNGGMQINHSVLNGRFFGGDVVNQQIVSGADINAPPSQTPSVPEPSSMAMVLVIGGLSISGYAWRRRRSR